VVEIHIKQPLSKQQDQDHGEQLHLGLETYPLWLNHKAVVTLRVPMIWLNTFEEHTGETLTEALPNTVFNDKVIVANDKLRINNQLYRTFFDYSIENVQYVYQRYHRPYIVHAFL
jgi:hypothetical protein